MSVLFCRRKLGLPCTLLFSYLIVVIGYGVFSYLSSREKELENIDESLRLVASQAKFILPLDFHDRAVTQDSISKKEDSSNVVKLSKYVSSSTASYGVNKVFTLVVIDGIVHVTASSRTPEELKTSKETPYFTPLGAPPPAVLKALRSHKPVVTDKLDDLTPARTLLLPEKSPSGRPYLACSEMVMTEVEKRVDAYMWRSLATSGFFILMAIPLVLIFRKTDKTHIEEFESIRELLHDKTLNRTSVIERKLNEFISKRKSKEKKPDGDTKKN